MVALIATLVGCGIDNISPEVYACDQFLVFAYDRCPGLDMSPYIGWCTNYNTRDDDCDYVAYFECLTDVLACDPETGEPNLVALLPCIAVADCDPSNTPFVPKVTSVP